MVEIEIDGKTLEVEQGSMIIEAADNAGIYIPRFCYHKKLSVAANCRMCLVEVEKAPKPLPACATPVTAGMKVYTCSDKAKDAQRSVMEFLLINHPLDCPICDQGGECELQDLSLGYGKDVSRFTEGKRSVEDDDLGSLIATEMTRCIQCTRCVRFGVEIAGIKELGATGRGEHMQITTYVEHSMESELSGNIIDLCPVGALTSKPFRFTARAWELQQAESIAPHDCMGSNIYVHSRRQQVMRVVPRENETINETWLSDRDRFSYVGLRSEDRLAKPMVKEDGIWQEVDWVVAFEKVIAGFKNILEKHGPQQIAALASPSSTTEEFYLFQKLMRALGCHSIDHRLQQQDFSQQEAAPLYPSLGIKIEELEKQDVIFLIGSNVRREQPMAWHRIRKANLRGAKVLSVNAVNYPINFEQTAVMTVTPTQQLTALLGIAKALAELNLTSVPKDAEALLKGVQVSVEQQQFAQHLQQGQSKIILLGALAQNHPHAAVLTMLSQLIAELSGAKLGYLTVGANSAGAWLAGAVPHRQEAGVATERGLTASEAIEKQLRGYFLLNTELPLDVANAQAASAALQNAEWVVALSPFKTSTFLEYADVILPIAAFTETSGTFVNAEGRWQSFVGVSPPPGEARPAWKVLRVLGNLFELPGFDYVSSEGVLDELKQALLNATPTAVKQNYASKIDTHDYPITRITEWPLYSVDSLVRRSSALQQAASNEATAVYLNEKLAQQLQVQEGVLVVVKQGEARVQLPVIINANIADHCVWIPAGREATAKLGPAFGAVEIYVA